MWTPALNRDRRIAMQDRRTRFFGTTSASRISKSATSITTIQAARRGDARHRRLLEDRSHTARGSPLQYTESTVWIRKSNYSYAQIENFDDTKVIRRLKYLAMENIQGIWTAKVLEMEDLTRNSKTILKTESLKYNLPMQDRPVFASGVTARLASERLHELDEGALVLIG